MALSFFYRNLTAVENRVRKLEAAFAQLLPGVDINGILDSSTDALLNQTGAELKIDSGAPVPPPPSNQGASLSPALEETLPQQPDGFDWVEETSINGLSDGMAALSIKPEGIGYLGECFVESYDR